MNAALPTFVYIFLRVGGAYRPPAGSRSVRSTGVGWLMGWLDKLLDRFLSLFQRFVPGIFRLFDVGL